MDWIALLAIIVSLVIFYIAGSFVLWLSRTAPKVDVFYETFVRLIVGLVSVVSAYAIVKTCGNTILWGFLIVGVLYLLYAKRNKLFLGKYCVGNLLPDGKKVLLPVLVMFLLGIGFFLFQGSFFYATPINNMPHGDYAFYSTVSSVLNDFGVEASDWQSVVIGGSTAPSPYHYFDIWLPVIFINILQGDTYEAFVVVTQSIYMVILAMGMIAVTRKVMDYTDVASLRQAQGAKLGGVGRILMQVLSVLSIFFAGLLFVKILPQSSDFIFSNSCSLKYLSVSMFVVWTVLAMLERKGGWYLPMLCLPVVNVITAPVAFTTAVLLLGMSALRRKQLKHVLLPLLSVFAVAVFIVLFYFLQAGESASGGLSLSTILDSFVEDKTKPFKIIFGSIVILFSVYAYYLLPTIVSAVSQKRNDYWTLVKDNAIVFVSVVTVVCVGTVVWGLTHVMADSIQFFMVSAIPWVNVAIWMLILFSFKIANKVAGYLVMAFVVLMAALNFYQIEKVPFYRYSQKYVDADYVKGVSAAISETEGLLLGVFIQDSSQMVRYWDFNCFGVGAEFKHFTSDLYLTAVYPEPNIDKFAEIDKPRIQKAVKGNPFQNFMIEYKSAHPDSRYDEIVLEFVKANDCKFVYLSGGCELPETIVPYIDKQFANKKTGECFFTLKGLN
ncbi:MAG: hypothetical protein J5542_04325 [Bacteroidales bacterium]|nr:hypothetical protein [Bacteroidales bacterium]